MPSQPLTDRGARGDRTNSGQELSRAFERLHQAVRADDERLVLGRQNEPEAELILFQSGERAVSLIDGGKAQGTYRVATQARCAL